MRTLLGRPTLTPARSASCFCLQISHPPSDFKIDSVNIQLLYIWLRTILQLGLIFFCQNLLFLNNVNQPNRRVSTSYKPCLLNRYQLLVMFLGWNNDPLFQHPPIKDDCHRTNASMDRIDQILSSGHGTHGM